MCGVRPQEFLTWSELEQEFAITCAMSYIEWYLQQMWGE
jgi:hypothetical protein